jgi:hypothetical protein
VLAGPFTDDDRARGYRYQLAFRRLELSDTRVFDRPQTGRDWFERTIRDQLALGRPDHVAVVFGRRISTKTPGRFWTRVFNRGVECGIQVHYRASKVKQYFKEGRALRTETTINDIYDFGIGRLLTPANWRALVAIGHQINERLLDAQLQACACAPDAATLERIVLPSTDRDGLPAPALRFGDPRAQALLSSLCAFQHLLDGVSNRSLRTLVASYLPGYTPRQMTYDLRRLRRNGFLARIEGSNRIDSPPTADAWPSSSPRPTRGSSRPRSPSSTPHSQPRSPPAHRSPAPGASFEHALDNRVRDAALTA